MICRRNKCHKTFLFVTDLNRQECCSLVDLTCLVNTYGEYLKGGPLRQAQALLVNVTLDREVLLNWKAQYS